jgi:hypothetical protein
MAGRCKEKEKCVNAVVLTSPNRSTKKLNSMAVVCKRTIPTE